MRPWATPRPTRWPKSSRRSQPARRGAGGPAADPGTPLPRAGPRRRLRRPTRMLSRGRCGARQAGPGRRPPPPPGSSTASRARPRPRGLLSRLQIPQAVLRRRPGLARAPRPDRPPLLSLLSARNCSKPLPLADPAVRVTTPARENIICDYGNFVVSKSGIAPLAASRWSRCRSGGVAGWSVSNT